MKRKALWMIWGFSFGLAVFSIMANWSGATAAYVLLMSSISGIGLLVSFFGLFITYTRRGIDG